MRALKSFLAFVALSGFSAPTFAEAMIRGLSAADDGKTITFTQNKMDLDQVNVTLDGNPTTGYSWTLAKIDGKSLVPVGDVAYKPDAHPAGMVGGGGHFIATFNVKETGKTTITMEYKRPWETTTPAAKSVTITVNIVSPSETQPATQK